MISNSKHPDVWNWLSIDLIITVSITNVNEIQYNNQPEAAAGGIYRFRFYRMGEWMDIIIDDQAFYLFYTFMTRWRIRITAGGRKPCHWWYLDLDWSAIVGQRGIIEQHDASEGSYYTMIPRFLTIWLHPGSLYHHWHRIRIYELGNTLTRLPQHFVRFTNDQWRLPWEDLFDDLHVYTPSKKHLFHAHRRKFQNENSYNDYLFDFVFIIKILIVMFTNEKFSCLYKIEPFIIIFLL